MRVQKLLVVVISIVTVLLFQNCLGQIGKSPAPFNQNSQNNEFIDYSREAGGGNSVGYDGKLTLKPVREQIYDPNFEPQNAKYYRMLIGEQCNDGASDIFSHGGVIEFINGISTKTVNSCSATSQPVNGTRVSTYNTKYLTQMDDIYEEGFDFQSLLDNQSYILALCRNNDDLQSGMEIIVKKSDLGPQQIAGATLMLDFTKDQLPAGLIFDREDYGNQVATYVGSDGYIKLAQPGAPRFEYHPLSGEPLGILLEDLKTNHIEFSEDFSQADQLANVAVQNQSEVAPDGSSSVQKLVETTVDGEHFVSWTVSKQEVDVSYNGSVFVKVAERSQVILEFTEVSTGGSVSSQFNLNDEDSRILVETASGITNVKSGIKKYKNGWYRIWMGVNPESSPELKMSLKILNDNQVSYQGEDNSGFFVWGAQIERKRYPTSYIPTSGQRVRRLGDDLTTENLDWFSAGAPGTFLVHWNLPIVFEDSATSPDGIIGKNSGPRTAFEIYHRENGEIVNTIKLMSRAWDGGLYRPDYQISENGRRTLLLQGIPWKGEGERINAFTYSPNEGTGYENGYPAGVGKLNSLPDQFSTMAIGRPNWGGRWTYFHANGHIKYLYYWPQHFNDEQMVSVSTLPSSIYHVHVIEGRQNGQGEYLKREVQNFPVFRTYNGNQMNIVSNVYKFNLSIDDGTAIRSLGELETLINDKSFTDQFDCRINPNH